MNSASPASLDIASLRGLYRSGAVRPTDVAKLALERSDAADPAIWISRCPAEAVMAEAARLDAVSPDSLPLYGLPFAVKDNIDVAGMDTTAACPAFACRAEADAEVVRRLRAAGAMVVGKTNLDQFATGLVGVRSPYGVPGNAFDPAFIPGGSSSGSAVAVARGLVSFALGTDTAGSGRVPAAFNNIVGLKPTRGAWSTTGVVPACRTLDCPSVFTLTAGDAAAVMAVAEGYDAADAYSRPVPAAAPGAPGQAGGLWGLRLAVPEQRQLAFFGDDAYAVLYAATIERASVLGARVEEVDFSPFLEAAALLYGGPWVAERYVAIRGFLEARSDALHPVTRQIIAGGRTPSAADAFAAFYRLAALARRAAAVWEDADALLIPTAGTIYTIAEVVADPIALNSNLGTYTNFMNLLDLCGVAVPAGFRPDGLPFGVTLAAPAFRDRALLRWAGLLHRAADVPMGATGHPLPG